MFYKITHIADGLDPHARILCNGDVYQSIWRQFSGLLRLLGDLDGLSELKLLYYYDGRKLSIYFEIKGTGSLPDEMAENFINGFAADIYGFKKVKSVPKLPAMAHSVSIVRKDTVIPSTVKPADNPSALDYYRFVRLFEPNASCDHMNTERAFGSLKEPVAVAITLRPCDVSEYISQTAKYQQRLKDVNSFSPQLSPLSGIRGQGEWTGIEKSRKLGDSVADDIRKNNAKLQLSLTKTNLQFDIKVSSATLSSAQYIASVFAEGAFKGGSYQILAEKEVTKTRQKKCGVSKNHPELTSIATIEELEHVFKLPTAGVRKPSTIRCHTDPPDTPEDKILVIGNDIIVGSMLSRKVLRGPLFNASKRHIGIFGISGSGKSVLNYFLLLQIAERNIPFLVIESGSKSDYRVLIKTLRRHPDKKMRQLGKKIRLLTPGDEAISSFRFNPFLPAKGVPVMLHAESILHCFLASAEWPDPSPAILRAALYKMMHEFQFGNKKPSMKKFIEHVHQHIDELSYSDKLKGEIHGVVETRLSVFTTGAIGRIFQTESNYPCFDEIVNGFTILEGAMLDNESLAFIVFSMLTAISGYFSVTPYAGDATRFFTFVEELQNLCAPVPPELVGKDDIRAKASRLLISQLLEARSKGNAFVLTSQAPKNVDSNILGNCLTTIVGRQKDPRNIDLLAGSMLFGPADLTAVKKLGLGEFLIFTEDYQRPCLVKVPDIPKQLGLDGSPFGRSILEFIEDCDWYQNDLRCRVTEELSMLEKRLGFFEREFLKTIGDAKSVLESNRKITSTGLDKLKSKMCKSLGDFFRDVMVPMAGIDNQLKLPEDLVKFKNLQIQRYEILRKVTENFSVYIDKRKGAGDGKKSK